MARLTKANLQEQYDELSDALAESQNKVDVLETDREALQEHRDELYESLDAYGREIHNLRADVAELANAGAEALAALEEANQEADAYGAMVDFYMRTLHAISAYGGQDASIPVGIAQAIIEPNLIPVELDRETGEVSNA